MSKNIYSRSSAHTTHTTQHNKEYTLIMCVFKKLNSCHSDTFLAVHCSDDSLVLRIYNNTQNKNCGCIKLNHEKSIY